MKNLLAFCFAMVAFTACKDDDGGGLSPCLDAKLEEFKALPEAVSIRQQKVKNDTHYWLNTAPQNLTGAWFEDIINRSCDTVCYYCGLCLLPYCSDEFDYVNEDWETIWEK